MIWSKKKQCVVCGFCTYRGIKLGHRKYMCSSCECEMIDDQCRDHEEQVWAELDRISNQRPSSSESVPTWFG